MPNSGDLIKSGIKPGQIFGQCLKCETLEQALELWHNSEEYKRISKPKTEKSDWSGIWEWLCTNPCFEHIFSREMFAIASNSERKRWLESGSVILNGVAAKSEDKMPDKVESLVFFPNGKHKCTIL